MTALNDALSGVRMLGFDTAPVVYFIERHPSYVDLMREVFRRVEAGSFRVCTSVITLTEVLTVPRRHGNIGLASRYRQLLRGNRSFTLVGIDADIAERAAELRAIHNLRTPDALQIAAAQASRADAFLTNDRRLRRVTEPRILVLDALEL